MCTDPRDQEYDPFSEIELLQADRDRLEAEKEAFVIDIDIRIDAINDELKQQYFDFIEKHANVPAKDLRKLLKGKTKWTEAAEKVLVGAEKPMSARVLVKQVQSSGYPHVTSNMVSTWLTRMKDKEKVNHKIFVIRKSGKKIGKWEWVGGYDD